MIETLTQTWDQFINLEGIWWRLAIAGLIFLLSLLVRKIFTRFIIVLMYKMTYRTRTGVDSAIVSAFENPLRGLIVVIGIFLALAYLSLSPAVMGALSHLLRSAIIIFIAWGFYNLAGVDLLKEFSEKLRFDHGISEFIAKVLRFIVIALAISIIAQEWGYNVNGFLAGLGLGGLAFALAAQDTVANIFGGIVILMDKPFSVGDWIFTPSVEGTVEEISFRSTKIRNFANARVTVPNKVVANEAITNWSRMQKRQVSFHLGLTYNTPRAKLQSCIHKIKDLLKNHPGVHPDVIFVNFDKFSDSSLDIFFNFFTKTTAWGDFMAVKEELNFKIMDILEEEGVSVAFPSRSIYFENKLKTAENNLKNGQE